VDAHDVRKGSGATVPENTSKLEVGAIIAVWVVIAVGLWALFFGWPGYRHHQRMDAAAAMTPKEASEAFGEECFAPQMGSAFDDEGTGPDIDEEYCGALLVRITVDQRLEFACSEETLSGAPPSPECSGY
jgi:hypothetical protein